MTVAWRWGLGSGRCCGCGIGLRTANNLYTIDETTLGRISPPIANIVNYGRTFGNGSTDAGFVRALHRALITDCKQNVFELICICFALLHSCCKAYRPNLRVQNHRRQTVATQSKEATAMTHGPGNVRRCVLPSSLLQFSATNARDSRSRTSDWSCVA